MHKDLPELVKAGIITEDTAESIRQYYLQKTPTAHHRLFIIFGVLGALLIGLGIILVIAHNWDDLSKSIKTIIAFAPLVIAQGLCLYVLLKLKESLAWRESTATFLVCGVGASISMVSQIYNISGNLANFILVWSLLSLPVAYLMRSSMVSLLYIAGITYYAAETGYWSYHDTYRSYFYWPILLLILPFYYNLFKNKPESNVVNFHHWLIPASICIAIGTFSKNTEELMFIVYISLFALFYLFGNTINQNTSRIKTNGYTILGSFGTSILLITLSFDWFWDNIHQDSNLGYDKLISSPEFTVAIFISLLTGMMLIWQKRNTGLTYHKPVEVVFLLFMITFFIGLSAPTLAVVIINITVLVLGVLNIRLGARHDHLGILNYGLLTIAALIMCRLFDKDMSFVVRGLLFICVGAGFIFTNYWMLKKRKSNGK